MRMVMNRTGIFIVIAALGSCVSPSPAGCERAADEVVMVAAIRCAEEFVESIGYAGPGDDQPTLQPRAFAACTARPPWERAGFAIAFHDAEQPRDSSTRLEGYVVTMDTLLAGMRLEPGLVNLMDSVAAPHCFTLPGA